MRPFAIVRVLRIAAMVLGTGLLVSCSLTVDWASLSAGSDERTDARTEDAPLPTIDALDERPPPPQDAGFDGDSPCSADLNSDANNCGRCGRSCGPTACSAGRCAPQIIAEGLNGPNNLFLANGRQYVRSARHVPGEGFHDMLGWSAVTGGPFTLVRLSNSDPRVARPGERGGLSQGAGYLFYIVNCAVARAQLDASVVLDTADVFCGSSLPTHASGGVYYKRGGGLISSRPLSQFGDTNAATDQPFASVPGEIRSIVEFGGGLAVATENLVTTLPVTNPNAQVEIASAQQNVIGLAALGDTLAWARVRADGPAMVWARPGQAQIDVVPLSMDLVPTGVALDETHAYFAARGAKPGTGVVGRVDRSSKAMEILAQGENEPGDVAVDGTHVYWVDRGTFDADAGPDAAPQDGSIRRVPK
jgi:hypothetical protein